MIPELRDLSYESRLRKYGLATFDTGRLRYDRIEGFLILNDYEILIGICSSFLKKAVEPEGTNQH